MKIDEFFFLIVEDEFIASEYLAQILRDLGAKNIIKAKNTNEALEIVSKNSIDLAFMDINLEGSVDGIECARLINEEQFIPIVFTTAYGDTHTINEAKQNNIFGYLIKPFQPSSVEASLHVAISTIKRIKEVTKPKEKLLAYDLGESYVYSFETKTVTLKQSIHVSLTKKELEVLDVLCRNVNVNLSYVQIKEIVWNDESISDSTIRDIISRLKKKIPHIEIENIVNFGYVLRT